MVTLTGQAVQNRYKDYCQISNANSGIDATKRAIEDGEGTASKLELSTTVVNIISGFELNDVSAQTGSVLKHEVGGLEVDVSAIADGGMFVGTAAGTVAIRTGVLTGGAAGFLKHELGGLEFDASAVTDGDVIVGTATGTMALRTGVFTAGAAGFLKHEVGGLEIDISAITTDQFIVGQSAGVVAVRTAAQTRTHLGLGTAATKATGTTNGTVPLIGAGDVLAASIIPAAGDTAVGGLETATQAEQETGTATDKIVTPGRQHFHQSAAKVWGRFTVAGSVTNSFNVSSVTDNGTGDWTVNLTTAFSATTAYTPLAGSNPIGGSANRATGATPVDASSYDVETEDSNGTQADPLSGDLYTVAYGDQ